MAASPRFNLAVRMGDNALVLAQRISAWCGHAPALEEDIAMANVALDLIGQARNWLGYAGEVEGEGRSADDFAYLRDGREFQNVLLVEQRNGDFGRTLMRQFLFDAGHYFILKALTGSSDSRIAEIADKSLKEVTYHLERSSDLVIRLGDGSEESHRRMQEALDLLHPFAGEMFTADKVDEAIAEAGLMPPLETLRGDFDAHVGKVIERATLTLPEAAVRKGGKQGIHSEDFGRMLAEMQVLRRTHPEAVW